MSKVIQHFHQNKLHHHDNISILMRKIHYLSAFRENAQTTSTL